MTRNGLILYLRAYLQADRLRGSGWGLAEERYRKLKSQNLLPEACDSEETINFLIRCLEDRRAYTLPEAIGLWEKQA